jgi:HD-GYP domain-containing protein (c-di-GMP phosphodiesterase class II)
MSVLQHLQITDDSATAESLSQVNPALVWSTFTRLVYELDACQQTNDQIRGTLEALRAATTAEVICWYNDATGEIQSVGNETRLSEEACAGFADKLLAKYGMDTDSFLWTNLRHDAERPHHHPTSAAALRLHRLRTDWLLAMSFDRERPLDANVVRMIGLAAAMLVKQQQQLLSYVRVKESLLGFVRCMAAVVDARDSCTAGHSERVSRIARCIGRQMELSRQMMSDLHIAGILHDVGKVGIRDEVLFKADKLTPEEYRHIQEHAVIGDQIVSTIKEFSRLRLGVRHHHERYDGSGYPDGLAGDDIPLLGRILAVADACDAMMSPRRYRGMVTPPHIDTVLVQGSGTQWDPEVVKHFMNCREEIYPPIYQKGIGDSAHHSIEEIMAGLRDGEDEFLRLADSELATEAND